MRKYNVADVARSEGGLKGWCAQSDRLAHVVCARGYAINAACALTKVFNQVRADDVADVCKVGGLPHEHSIVDNAPRQGDCFTSVFLQLNDREAANVNNLCGQVNRAPYIVANEIGQTTDPRT